MARLVKTLSIRRFKPGDGLNWLKTGLRLMRRQPMVWLLASLIFVPGAWILTRIPIFGELGFAFILPIVLGSGFIWLDMQSKLANPKPVPISAAGKEALVCLFGVFRKHDAIAAVVVLAVGTLVVTLLLNIVEQLMAGPGRLPSASLLDLAAADIGRFLGVKLLVYVILVAVGTVYIYSLPWLMLEEVTLPKAVRRSLRAVRRNYKPLAVFCSLLLMPFLLAQIAGLLDPMIKHAILLSAGLVVYPLAVSSLFVSYRLTYVIQEKQVGGAAPQARAASA